MRYADYVYEFMQHVWTHPVSGVRIYAEDMPEELMPCV